MLKLLEEHRLLVLLGLVVLGLLLGSLARAVGVHQWFPRASPVEVRP